MATEADVPEAISIAKEEGVERSLTIEQLDRTVDQCSPVELNKPKGDLDHHPDVQLEKPFANGKNVQVEYSMEVESKNNSFGVSEGEHFLDPLSKISQGEQSSQAGMETPKSEVQLQKGTQVGGPVEETGSEDNEVIEERKEKFAEEENHDISIGAGIISEITKATDETLEVEEVEASINETDVDQVISNQLDSINEDVQCLEKEAEISSIDLKGAEMADGNDESYQKEASDLLEATTFQEYEASISTHDVANSSFKKDTELETNVTSNDEEDSQKTLQKYEQKEELKKMPEVTPEDAKIESNEVAEVITCREEEKTTQNAAEYAENEEANPVHCPKENDTVNEEVCEATSTEQETAEHALLEIHAAENHPQEFSEEKSRDYQPSVEAAHLSTDTVEENLEEQAIQDKSPSLVEEETTKQISREEVHSLPLEEEKEADAKCEDPIEVVDTTREIKVETTEQRSETNKDIYVPIPKEESYTDESTQTFVENNSFPSEVSEVKTKEIIQEDQPIVSDYGLVSGEVSQVSALEEAEVVNKEHVNNSPEEKGLPTVFTDETVVETEDYAEAGANFNSETIEKEIQAAEEDEGELELKETDEDKDKGPVANANIAPVATIIPDQPALHTEDIELKSEENVNSKDKLEEQIPTAADEGGNGLIEAQTENFKQVTDTDIAAEEKDPETSLTYEKALDVKDFGEQAEKAFSSEENSEKQVPVVAYEGKKCLKEAEEEKEQEALTTIAKGEPPLDIEVNDKQAEENFSPNENLEELIPEGADKCHTGLKEAEEEKEQVKITDDAPEEKVTILTDERALFKDEIELQVEENVSSIDNLDEQIQVTAEEGDAGLKEPDEYTFDSSPEKNGLATILTYETTQVAEDTDVRAGDYTNSNEIEGESCSTEPQEVVADITPEEKIVNSQEKLQEQVPVVADEGDTGINETEEENKEQTKCEDTTPEEKGLPIISTDDTALACEEIESQSEGNVSSTDSLEKQIPTAADEAEYGLTEAKKQTTEQSTITDITPEVKSVPMILTDQTALDSETIELHEEENVKSVDYLEKQTPIAADVGVYIFTEAKAESNEQVAITDITPEEKGAATILINERSLETEHTNLQSVECGNSIANLKEEISPAPELGDTCLIQEDEEVHEEQVESSDSSQEVKVLATILKEETSQDIEYADVQAGENFNLEDILEKQIPSAVHEGEKYSKEVEEDNEEQVETTEIAPEEITRGTILSEETAEGVELTNAQVEEINLKEVLEEQIPTASNAGETDLKEAEADIKEQVETTDIIPERKGVDTILSDERDLDLEDVHVQEKEEVLEEQIPPASNAGEKDLKEGEADIKEQVETTDIIPEQKGVAILSDERDLDLEEVHVQEKEEVLEEQIPTASNAGETDLKEAEADIKEQVETTDIIPEKKSVDTILSDERDLDLEDVHVQEKENFSLNESLTVDEGVTGLKGEAETKEQVNSTYIAPEEKDVTTISRDEMAAEIQHDDVQAEETFEASEGEEKAGVATAEQSYQVPGHEEAEPKIAVEDEKSEEHPERNHVVVEEILDKPTITSRDYSEEQIIEPNVSSCIPELIEEDTIKSSTETIELKEEGSCIENTKEENASDLTREYTLQDATEQIENKDYNAVKSGYENLEDPHTAEVDESTTCETKNVEPSEEIIITSYDGVQQGEGSSPAPTEKLNEERSSLDYIVEDNANDISTECVAEDIDDKLKECIEEIVEAKGKIIEGNVATSKPELIEEETIKNSQDSEKVTIELKEEGSCTESIKEENASELSPEYKEDAFDSEDKILEDSKTVGVDQSTTCETVNVETSEETPSTLPVVQLLIQNQVQENIDEDTFSFQETKDDDNGAVTVTETIAEVASNDEEGSPQVLQKSEQDEEVTTEQGDGSSPASTEALNQANVNEDTLSAEVVKDDGNYGAVNLTEMSAEVPSNDKEAPEVLQNYEPEEAIEKSPDLEHQETTPESSSENAKEEIERSLDKEKDTKESETSSGEACTEGAELSAEGEKENSEDQTTREVSPLLIVETSEESSKEEEKSEGHFECQDSIEESKSQTLEDTTKPKPISDEESNKTLVEDNSNSLEASEKEVEKEIKGEYSSTIRSLDSEVVSDNQTSFTEATAVDNEQVETTQIAAEQKDNEGIEVYKTELFGETIGEPSLQVQTLEEAATPKLDVEAETDKLVDLPEKNNKIWEEVLEEPKITDRDFNVEQTTEGNVSNLTTEATEEYDAIKDYQGEEKETEKLNEEGSCIETINEGTANDISTESAPEDKDEKLTECIEEAFEEQITDRNVKTFSPESIEYDTVQNSQDNEKEVKEYGSCTESIKEENVSELKEEYKEDGSKSGKEILEDSKTGGVDESITCATVNVETSEETPSTLPVVQLLLQNQVQENIEETKDGDDGAVTITETSAEVPSNDSPQLLQKYEPEEELTNLRDVLPEETKIESSSEFAEVITCTKEERQEENDTSTGEVLETTFTEALQEIHPVEDTTETEAEYQACIGGAELSVEGEKENSEDQTTQEVSHSLIVETNEDSSKEEEKSEGHFECRDKIEEAKSETLEDTAEPKPISEEESNKTLVEDNSNSLEASEKEVEKEIKGEYSSTVTSLDSEVVSDNQTSFPEATSEDSEQVETTQIAPEQKDNSFNDNQTSFTEATAVDNEQVETTQIAAEQKDNEGIEVYKTELFGETIGEPSLQVQTLEEAATPKLDVEAETDKSDDPLEKNNKSCEKVLQEPKITDRDFNVEQTTEGIVASLTTEVIEEQEMVKDYQGEEKEAEKLNDGSCIETVNEGNANDISTESAPEVKDETFKECIEEAVEEQITESKMKTFTPESIGDDTVRNSQESEKEPIEVKEENASELSEEYKEDASKSEEEILEDSKSVGVDETTTCETVNVEKSEETPSTLPVVQLLLQNQVQENIEETKDGDDGAVTITETSAEVPSNDSPQLLQKYEPEKELTNLRDVLPEETKIESSSENAEVVTCTKEETQDENDTSTGEASIEASALSNEVEKEQQTTGEVSSSPVGEETTEESSKEEDREEGHEECKEASVVTMEEISNKTIVEDGPISSDASEEVIEKEIQGEYSSTSRSLDSEVVSDQRGLMEAPEQLEATLIAPEEKDIGGTDDVYSTELVGQTTEPNSQVQTVEEEVEPKLEVEDENDKADDHPEKSDNICEEVLDEPMITDRNFNEEQITEVHNLEDKVYVAERTYEETKEVEVSNLALEKLDFDAPEETIECSESDSKCSDVVTEGEIIAAQTRDEEISKEPSTLLCEETELRASEQEHTKEVEVPTEEDTGDLLVVRSAEEMCLPKEEPRELNVSELALEKLDAGQTEEETTETASKADSQSIALVTEDEIITDQTQWEGEKELEASEVVQEALNADAPEEETKDGSAMVLECKSESNDELVKEELQIPSTAFHPEEKELTASENEHEITSVERSTEVEIPKEVEVPADENKQELFAATPIKTCLQTEEPRDTESALYKLDVDENEEETKGTLEKVTRFDSQSIVMASRDEIIVDQILCEGITGAPLSKERELGASELALEKMAAVDTEEIKEGPEIVPNFDSGIIDVVSNYEITSDQTFNDEMLKEQIQSPSSTLLPEEKEHETFEPESETIAQEKSTEQECTKEVEVSVGESSQALLAERSVEEECSQKEEPSELNVSELSLGKIDAGDTEEANKTCEMVSIPDFPSIVADSKEITVDEALSKGVTDIPPEIPSYTSFHEEMEPKASELYLEKLDANIPEEVEGSEVISQLVVSQSSCEILKDETVADQLKIPSSALFPDGKVLQAPEHDPGTVINEKNLKDENLKDVKAPIDEASEYVFVARSVDETCLQKEEPSKLEVPESALEKLEANGAEEVKTETVSKSDSQSINAVPKDDSTANQTLSDVMTDMPLNIPSYTSLPMENEEAKEDATGLPPEQLEADETAEVKKGYEVTPKSDLQSFDVVAKDEIITDQVLHEGIAEDEHLIQSSILLPEEKELKETEHEHGTAPQDKNLEDECAKESEVTADRDLRDVVVPSSEEKTHLQKEEAGELKVSELFPESEGECEGEKEITATFESTDAVLKEETTAEQTLHQQEEQLQIASPTSLHKERDEATVHKEELEDCKVLELSLKGDTEEETKEAFETSHQVSSESIGELVTGEIVDQIPPSSLISEKKSCENITTINNAGEESMNVVRSPNDESRKDTNSPEKISIPNEEPRELSVSDLEFPASQYTERESSNEGKNLEVATFDSGADNSCETTVGANQTVKNEVQNEEIKDEKEVGKDSQLISVGEEYVRGSQQENESREEYPEETNNTFTTPNEYYHEVAEVDRTGRLSGDIQKQVIPDDKSFKDRNPDEAERRIQETAIPAGLQNQGDEINCETNTVEVTYPGQKGSSVEISQGVVGVGEANGTTQDTMQLEKESHATNIPSSKDDAQNFLQDLKSEDTKPSNDTFVVRDTAEEKICGSATETVDSTSAQCSLSERLLEESAKERIKVVTHLTEEKEPTVGKELQAYEEEEYEHENVEAKTDEEKEDFEHKRASQGYDEPVIVEASRDSEMKVSSKKSHNILSGMGKSVKHSISKVKKAIIGKSSNSKTQSEK